MYKTNKGIRFFHSSYTACSSRLVIVSTLIERSGRHLRCHCGRPLQVKEQRIKESHSRNSKFRSNNHPTTMRVHLLEDLSHAIMASSTFSNGHSMSKPRSF